MIDEETIRVIETRTAELSRWLGDEAPYTQFDQHHLDASTPEQAYWHLGYRTALADVLGLIKSETARSGDTSNRSPVADPDA